jgi:hypothetical protein
VLLELHASLKPGGVLFSANPHGHNEEGWNGGRYGVYYDLRTWRHYVSAAGFVELSHYYRPAGLRRERQPWLASVWRREGVAAPCRRPTPSPTGAAHTGQGERRCSRRTRASAVEPEPHGVAGTRIEKARLSGPD